MYRERKVNERLEGLGDREAFANIAAVERLQTKLIDGLDLDDKPSLQEAFQYRAALDVVLSIAKKALIQKLSSEGGLQGCNLTSSFRKMRHLYCSKPGGWPATRCETPIRPRKQML